MTRRLLLGSLFVNLVVLVIVLVPLGILRATDARKELLAAIERDAHTIADFVEENLEDDGGGTVDVDQLVANYLREVGGRIVIVDASGRAVADADPSRDLGRDFSTRPEIAGALAGGIESGTRRSETLAGSLVFVAVPVSSGGTIHGAVRITYPTHELDERIRVVWEQLGVVATLSLLVAGTFAVAMARWVTRPVNDLQVSTRRFGGGELGHRAADDRGPPEVRELAADFNTMATRLEALVRAQEQFVADASHQLRTPLTALRLRLENMAADSGSGEEIDATLAEVGRLSRIVDGLLTLARADRSVVPPAPVDIATVVATSAGIWADVAADQGVELVAPDRPATWALATEDRVNQVLDNLVANALDVMPAGGTLRLDVAVAGDEVVLTVADSGPGMDADARERAFDRFWTSGTERRFGGTGLGLAIVAKLVEADGGSVSLAAVQPHGLCVTVRYRAPAP